MIVKLLGGLGNQMFQYATGRAVANRLGAQLLLDVSAFEEYDLRCYELDAFAIEGRVVSPNDLEGVGFGKTFPSWLKRIVRAVGVSRQLATYKESGFAYDENILRVESPVVLDGYWQSERYFQGVANDLRREFVLTLPLDAANRRMLELILDQSSQAVSLHVRRGDYVNNVHTAQFHGVCSLDYYRLAVEHVVARVENPHFFIFSDDPEWVADNILLDHPTEVVAVNSADRGVFDLNLMMSCRHHIVANSSFSWWGAWLNPNVDKVVVAPKRWFSGASLDTCDLIPSSWIRL